MNCWVEVRFFPKAWVSEQTGDFLGEIWNEPGLKIFKILLADAFCWKA
jgi:hypothetical protein